MSTPGSLQKKTVAGLKWSYAATGVQALLQVVLTVTLARLLTPKDFGLVALATVAVRFGQYFAQFGLGQALVQSAEIDERDVRTCATTAALLGLAFAAATALLAPLAGDLFDEPAVVPLLRFLGLTFIAAGFRVTSLALLQRALRIRAMAIIDVATISAGYVGLSIALAALGFGAWSLVIASVAQAFLAAGAAYAVVRHSLRPLLARDSLRRLTHFGSRASLIGFLEFLSGNLDTIWTGRTFSAREVGFYNRSFNLVNLPLYFITASFSRVLVSAFSRLQARRERLRGIVVPALTVAVAAGAATFWGLAGATHEVVAVLLGPTWSAVAAPMAILALAGPFVLFSAVAAVLCEATATLNVKIAVVGTQVALLCLLLVTLGRHSLAGVALSLALSQAWAALWYVLATTRVLRCSARVILSGPVTGLLTGAVTGAVTCALSYVPHSGFAATAVLLAAQVVLAGAAAAALVLRGFHGRTWAALRLLADQAGLDAGSTGFSARAFRWLDGLAAAAPGRETDGGAG